MLILEFNWICRIATPDKYTLTPRQILPISISLFLHFLFQSQCASNGSTAAILRQFAGYVFFPFKFLFSIDISSDRTFVKLVKPVVMSAEQLIWASIISIFAQPYPSKLLRRIFKFGAKVKSLILNPPNPAESFSVTVNSVWGKILIVLVLLCIYCAHDFSASPRPSRPACLKFR